jgi:hypothetical protein
MKLRIACAAIALAASTVFLPAPSDAAGASIRARFSYDGLATCQQPPVTNYPIHGEGTGVLSTDRTAKLDLASSSEGHVKYEAKLGARPTAAPEGSASLRVMGRHTLQAVREYPNNYIIINLTVVGNTCSIKMTNRLKPGKHQYTFVSGSSLSYCSAPVFTRTSCEPY